MHAEQVSHLVNVNWIFYLMLLGWGTAAYFGLAFWQARKEIKRLSKPFGLEAYYQLWNELSGVIRLCNTVSLCMVPIHVIQRTLGKVGVREYVEEQVRASIRGHGSAVRKLDYDIGGLNDAARELKHQLRENPRDAESWGKLEIATSEIARLQQELRDRREAIEKLSKMAQAWRDARTDPSKDLMSA